mmetsp:Transcript_1561/g.2501  ORF Transcript_1561/g.2501 Transcript_1561/m.2501 type:complete len:179 (+) Transcript_1561:128-664(+)|eukprot:CAMPEP_0185020854 /NCGR_PEP_ID=MMETSP1103-20130426/3501_1 /TAXON_ID=36769 /ORGANISM="Paraphysomonas bandaiensis, Strain Caron Lab Isolate" /LENGTH=178 /DNA_ID=CAMNT_0027552015 /DNA_START=114 /DNA_END=650 /DNA_ORIENTATION=-
MSKMLAYRSKLLLGDSRVFVRNFQSTALLCSGGGGGRPGGKPVLNWKMKRALDAGYNNEEGSNEEVKLKLSGDFEDLEKLFDMSEALEVDLTNMDNFDELKDSPWADMDIPMEENELFVSPKGSKKKTHDRGPRSHIVTPLLFGSNKAAHKILRVREYKRERLIEKGLKKRAKNLIAA